MTLGMIQPILVLLILMILGPYSDRFGRKPLLQLSCVGMTLYFGLLTGLAVLSDHYAIGPWVFCLSGMVFICTGSTATLVTAMLCYVSDISSEKDRSFRWLDESYYDYSFNILIASRITIIECMLGLGSFVGSVACTFLVTICTPQVIFFASFLCGAISLIYFAIMLKESVQITEDDQKMGFMASFEWFKWVYW